MLNTLDSDLLNAFLLALVIIGVRLIGFGIIQFINTTNQLNENSAYQARPKGGEVTLNSNAQA